MKMSSQIKHDEEKRRSLQVSASPFVALKNLQRCLQPLFSLQAENKAALQEVRGLQERLQASEHVAESLRREMRELATRQSYTHAELHQARLQVAQLSLQLSEEDLVLMEERASWALEREASKQEVEVRGAAEMIICLLCQPEDVLFYAE